MCSHIHDKRQKWQKYMHSSLNGNIIIFLCSMIFTFILDITSHPNPFFSLPLWNEKNCPNFCCKKLPNWDLWPKIFDPTSCLWSNHFQPQSILFQYQAANQQKSIWTFFTTQSNLNPRCSLFTSQKKVGPELQSSKWGFPSSRSRRASIGFSALFSCFAGCG